MVLCSVAHLILTIYFLSHNYSERESHNKDYYKESVDGKFEDILMQFSRSCDVIMMGKMKQMMSKLMSMMMTQKKLLLAHKL